MLEHDLLTIALDAADAAAALIATAVASEVGTKSTATDMVTEVDRTSEALIISHIHDARPHDGWLGEEGAVTAGSTGVRWIIDPLDGTTNFLYRFPVYAVSIAAELDGEVVAGVVHDVVHDETFTAIRGGGAFRNGSRLRLASTATLATALVGTGFSYSAEVRAEQAITLSRLLPSIRDVRRSGSAALDLCWVGAARLDGYYERGLNVWDLAAGRLVAAEAGAWVGLVDDITVAIAPQLAEEFVALLARSR